MWLALLPTLVALAAFTVMAPPFAAAEGRARVAQAAAAPEPLVQSEGGQRARAQLRPRPRSQARPRARIWVYSRYPYRRTHSIYPLPYPIEYPGPNAVRQCVNNYVVELRPSGDVVVPRTRCWWAPG